MANLIVICGPQAVGEMTVAESLRDKPEYNLMLRFRLEAREREEKEYRFGV